MGEARIHDPKISDFQEGEPRLCPFCQRQLRDWMERKAAELYRETLAEKVEA